jgi:predicted amidohydrolase YtcJ
MLGRQGTPLTQRAKLALVRAQQPTAAPLVFDGVTVIDAQLRHRLPAQRVVIMGNRIRTVGNVSAVPLPAGARVVDARGKYLMPGLWDMHTHVMRSTDFFYPLFIANGVTGIRDAASMVGDCGEHARGVAAPAPQWTRDR